MEWGGGRRTAGRMAPAAPCPVGRQTVTPAAALAEVRLERVPLDIYREASEHHDELLREFALITEGQRAETADGPDAVPARLLALIDDLTARFAGFTASTSAELRAALARGDDRVDLVYRVPPEAAPAAAEFDRMLEEADEFCRAGDLLTLATPPEVVQFRRWFLNEFVAQVGGAEPTPFPGRYGGTGPG